MMVGPGSACRRSFSAPTEVTALLSLCPQQEGLDDGPDFLSEEERGVSVRRSALCVRLLRFSEAAERLL